MEGEKKAKYRVKLIRDKALMNRLQKGKKEFLMAKKKTKPMRIIVSYYPGYQERVLRGLQYGYGQYLEHERERLEGPMMPPYHSSGINKQEVV